MNHNICVKDSLTWKRNEYYCWGLALFGYRSAVMEGRWEGAGKLRDSGGKKIIILFLRKACKSFCSSQGVGCYILSLTVEQCLNGEAESTRTVEWEVSSMCHPFAGTITSRVYFLQYRSTVILPWYCFSLIFSIFLLTSLENGTFLSWNSLCTYIPVGVSLLKIH